MGKEKSNVVKVLRVAVNNNFNYTEDEFRAIKELGWDDDRIFVNSNSFVTIKDDYPSFITVNPYLDAFVEPEGELSNIRACRIKFVQNATPPVHAAFVKALRWAIDRSIPVLITFQRFKRRVAMSKFISGPPEGTYTFERNYWRLTAEAKQHAVSMINSLVRRDTNDQSLLYFCDLAGEGCPSCGNCAKLSGCSDPDKPWEMWGVSLAESGDAGRCCFHCPDCWAKTLDRAGFIKYGKVSQNSKQRGYSVK